MAQLQAANDAKTATQAPLPLTTKKTRRLPLKTKGTAKTSAATANPTDAFRRNRLSYIRSTIPGLYNRPLAFFTDDRGICLQEANDPLVDILGLGHGG